MAIRNGWAGGCQPGVRNIRRRISRVPVLPYNLANRIQYLSAPSPVGGAKWRLIVAAASASARSGVSGVWRGIWRIKLWRINLFAAN